MARSSSIIPISVTPKHLTFYTKTYLKSKHPLEIAHSLRDDGPHVEERALQELLHRHGLATSVLNEQLGSEDVPSPEERPA